MLSLPVIGLRSVVVFGLLKQEIFHFRQDFQAAIWIGIESSHGTRIDLNGAIVWPSTILLFLLLFGFGHQQTRAIGREQRVGDPMLGIDGVQGLAGSRLEQ